MIHCTRCTVMPLLSFFMFADELLSNSIVCFLCKFGAKFEFFLHLILLELGSSFDIECFEVCSCLQNESMKIFDFKRMRVLFVQMLVFFFILEFLFFRCKRVQSIDFESLEFVQLWSYSVINKVQLVSNGAGFYGIRRSILKFGGESLVLF